MIYRETVFPLSMGDGDSFGQASPAKSLLGMSPSGPICASTGKQWPIAFIQPKSSNRYPRCSREIYFGVPWAIGECEITRLRLGSRNLILSRRRDSSKKRDPTSRAIVFQFFSNEISAVYPSLAPIYGTCQTDLNNSSVNPIYFWPQGVTPRYQKKTIAVFRLMGTIESNWKSSAGSRVPRGHYPGILLSDLRKSRKAQKAVLDLAI